jgi:hypothetical protein
MAKKIEIDIAHLKSIGISQTQIQEIIKKAQPNHWTNNLPDNRAEAYTVRPFLFTPEISLQGSIEVFADREIQPTLSFYTEEDADFVIQKCNLLIEMSNFCYSLNEDWTPNWNNKEQKKYGIVLQNGIASIKENELFNIFVFGIALKSRVLALEMLEEFRARIEKYFNKPFNSLFYKQILDDSTPIYSTILSSGTTLSDETTLSASISSGTTIESNNQSETSEILKNIDVESEILEFTYLDELKCFKRKKRKKLNQEDSLKIKNMLNCGFPQKEIALDLGYSEGLISRVKRSLSFDMRKRTLNLNKS